MSKQSHRTPDSNHTTHSQHTDQAEDAEATAAGAGFEAVLAGAALHGFGSLVPPVRDLGALTASVVRRPGEALRRVGQTAARLAEITTGIDQEPGRIDRRFADEAWSGNPMLRRLALSYLTLSDAATSMLDDADLDWRTRERLRMPLDNFVAALAPPNSLFTNPAGWKHFIDTGGSSLIAGTRQFVTDALSPAKLPTSVEREAFRLGDNIAATPGAVIHRTALCELIEYLPVTDEVDTVPVLMVPSPVNKYYLLDLEPDRSVIREELEQGRRIFVPSWTNPGVEDAEIGFDAYVEQIVEALQVVRKVTGSQQVHLLGLCGGGVLAYLTAGYLAATDRQEMLATLTIAIAVIDYHRGPAPMAFMDKARVERSARTAARRGFFDARSSARSFALMRPTDGIWSSFVNNYVMGRPPPRIALLAWAADQTNLTATFGTQLLRAASTNALVRPGAVSVLGVPLDPGLITVDTFNLGADTDHISPWTDCYRTGFALGGPVEFVLGKGGHAMVIAKGPSASRTRYWTGPMAADSQAWRDGADEHTGSWWAYWNEWIEKRTPERIKAPSKPGNTAYPALAAAPGEYVRRVVT